VVWFGCRLWRGGSLGLLPGGEMRDRVSVEIMEINMHIFVLDLLKKVDDMQAANVELLPWKTFSRIPSPHHSAAFRLPVDIYGR